MTTTTAADLIMFAEPDREFARHYEEFGFALLAGALNPAEIGAVNDELLRLCRGDYGAIRYGYPAPGDAPAVDIDPRETDEELLRRYLCIHHPHKVSPAAHAALAHPRIVRGLTAVIGPNVKAMQSMLFIKSEGKPGQAWHQDEFFIPTRDRSLTAVWIALDDATVENGCLWVLPGSHRAASSTRPRSRRTRASTAPSRHTASPTPTPMPFRWRFRPAPPCSSTATCCTGRCRTPASTATAEHWRTTT